MNPFNIFNFGGFIKTFVPGFAIYVAVMVGVGYGARDVSAWLASNKEIALVLAILGSIFFGLMCNTFVFMGLNDWLVRGPHSKSHVDLAALEKEIDAKAKTMFLDRVGISKTYASQLDAEVLLTRCDAIPPHMFWLERYFFYFEFDLNMMIAGGLLSTSLLLVWLQSITPGDIPSVLAWVCCLMIALASCVGLWLAARRNYDRHRHKIMSLRVAALYDLLQQERALAAKSAQSG